MLGSSLLTSTRYGDVAKLRSGLDVGDLKTEHDGERRRLAALFRRRLTDGARDERGVVAIIFALAVVVLVPLVLGLFDLYTATEQRARLQDAIDAAALYAARSDKNTDAEIDALGDKALSANLKLIRGTTLISSDFSLADNNTKVIGSAKIQTLAIAPFFSHPAMTVSTQVVRNSKNLEVSLMLDVTGSMNSGTRIADLRAAAVQLVDLVVKDQQTPFYSKLALVPWSAGVNLGSYADGARGAPVASKAITGAAWASGTAKTITGISNANPGVVTASNNFINGDYVYITGVKGMTQVNNKIYVVANATSASFKLSGVNTNTNNGYNVYTSGGTVTKCLVSTCALVVTSNNHGFTNGAYVVVKDLGGITTASVSLGGASHNVNGNGTPGTGYVYTVGNVTANTFSLAEAVLPSGTYTSGGSASCTTYGCPYYRFTPASGGGVKVFTNSTCVSERTGTNSYTDVSPATSPVGFNYPAENAIAPSAVNTTNKCLTNQVVPLSTDKTSLKATINGLVAEGSTGGQVGTAWGWYMVSPNFGSLWPNASQRPALYTQENTIKAVVLMTDGALNSPYCNGVIAKDALSGSGSASDHESCNSTNGTTLAQSLALCAAMHTAGVVVYTVGFQITGDTNAETLINTCATDSRHVYLPTSGAQLSDAFKAIGVELNNLRIAH